MGNEEDGRYRGETFYTPFQRAARDYKMQDELHNYRFIVTKERRKDGQINTFTGEACIYSIIMTNDEESEPDSIVFYYNQRGTIEKECEVYNTISDGRNCLFPPWSKTRSIFRLWPSAEISIII